MWNCACARVEPTCPCRDAYWHAHAFVCVVIREERHSSQVFPLCNSCWNKKLSFFYIIRASRAVLSWLPLHCYVSCWKPFFNFLAKPLRRRERGERMISCWCCCMNVLYGRMKKIWSPTQLLCLYYFKNTDKVLFSACQNVDLYCTWHPHFQKVCPAHQ